MLKNCMNKVKLPRKTRTVMQDSSTQNCSWKNTHLMMWALFNLLTRRCLPSNHGITDCMQPPQQRTRRPASADRKARRQFQATGQPVSQMQASDAMTSRLPRYVAKCVQRRCFQKVDAPWATVPSFVHATGTRRDTGPWRCSRDRTDDEIRLIARRYVVRHHVFNSKLTFCPPLNIL